MFIKNLITTAIFLLLFTSFGCTKTIRLERPGFAQVALFDANAPDWVRGQIPDSESRIYFVGRSEDPRIFGYQGYIRGNSNVAKQEKYYYPTYFNSWATERDAVSSARDDIYDQVRQRLAPRNVGNSSNYVVNNVDSGTCADCGSVIPVSRTNVIVCNDTCTHSKSKCNSTRISSTSSNSFYCQDCHSVAAHCSGCATIVHAVTQLNRTPDHLNSADIVLDRDINVININVDSMMPSLAAYMTEDELYFGHGTGWHEFKCWMLCSIPANEFYQIAEDFREKYEAEYTLAKLRSEEDRNRRIQAEDESRLITLERQSEEREWNREDEIVTRSHTIQIDRDRNYLPGRRFTLESE